MAILAFQKPDKVLMLESNNNYGKFEFKPLEPGYGITVGNALRRVLLSSLEGYAISSIRIDGVKHEFDTIPGVKEDVTNIILNLKKVDLKQTVEDTDFEKATITVSGTEVFTAGDISKALSGFEVLNPDLVICHLDPDASFTIVLTINKGRGWVPAEENEVPGDDINTLAIDSTTTKPYPYSRHDTRIDGIMLNLAPREACHEAIDGESKSTKRQGKWIIELQSTRPFAIDEIYALP